jgi:hypothetical protein
MSRDRSRPERRFWKPDVSKDVEDELAVHLEMRQREYVERGVDPAEARDIAARRFGDVQSIAATCRDIDTDIADCRLMIVDWGDCGVVDCRLADCRMENAECRVPNAEC